MKNVIKSLLIAIGISILIVLFAGECNSQSFYKYRTVQKHSTNTDWATWVQIRKTVTGRHRYYSNPCNSYPKTPRKPKNFKILKYWKPSYTI